MKRAITAAMALGMLLLCACNSILDGEILITSQRRPPSAQEAEDEMSVVTTYSELSDLISDMLFRHEESALVKVVDYAGELSADLERVRTEYLTVIPIGVFALEDMYIEAGTVVSVVELDITLT
ncbi:MAG: hypothetical protein LBC78_04745, partial [Oscillospiraceae bacterium]|nr:hypothetical protein [Oscillospiraceae bacterium]